MKWRLARRRCRYSPCGSAGDRQEIELELIGIWHQMKILLQKLACESVYVPDSKTLSLRAYVVSESLLSCGQATPRCHHTLVTNEIKIQGADSIRARHQRVAVALFFEI